MHIQKDGQIITKFSNSFSMKKSFLLVIVTLICMSASAQFVAIMEVTDSIPGICDSKAVYVLFPMLKGQEEAVCPVSENEILKRLNSELAFLKENPKYQDKGMIGLVINCKGELVKCKMDNNTKSPELDKQIEVVFNTLGDWKAGKLDGTEVDSSKLYSFKIKKGKVTFD